MPNKDKNIFKVFYKSPYTWLAFIGLIYGMVVNYDEVGWNVLLYPLFLCIFVSYMVLMFQAYAVINEKRVTVLFIVVLAIFVGSSLTAYLIMGNLEFPLLLVFMGTVFFFSIWLPVHLRHRKVKRRLENFETKQNKKNKIDEK